MVVEYTDEQLKQIISQNEKHIREYIIENPVTFIDLDITDQFNGIEYKITKKHKND